MSSQRTPTWVSNVQPCMVMIVGILLLTVLSSASAEPATLPARLQPVALDSGAKANPSNKPRTVFQQVIDLGADVPWARVFFDEVGTVLQPGSYIRVTSLLDGETQILDAQELANWNYATAFFNGSQIEVELIAGAGTTGNNLTITEMFAGELTAQVQVAAADQDDGTVPPLSICGGDDDRKLTDHKAVGRLLPGGARIAQNCVGGANNGLACTVAADCPGGKCVAAPNENGYCTAWIEASQKLTDPIHLTAGHCFPGVDDFGRINQNFDLDFVLQFDVPPSNANCTIIHPAVASQFPVKHETVISRGSHTCLDPITGTSSGQRCNRDIDCTTAGELCRISTIGDDWAIFKCGKNNETPPKTTFEKQGQAFTLRDDLIATTEKVRVSGYGVDGSDITAGTANNSCTQCPVAGDNGTRNAVLQTHAGPLLAGVPAAHILNHQVDTCGANSGSPIIAGALLCDGPSANPGAACNLHVECQGGGTNPNGRCIVGTCNAVSANPGAACNPDADCQGGGTHPAGRCTVPEASLEAIGIHTHGGCDLASNSGTAVKNPDLKIALETLKIKKSPPPVLDFAIDHFKVWKTDLYNIVPPYPISLVDQFQDPIMVNLNAIEYFANAVEKTHGIDNYPRLDPNAHLIWYPINVEQPQREITVYNQFKPLGLKMKVKDARYVLIPAIKNGGGPPNSDFNDDLYLCYDIVDPAPVNQPVTLFDQFDGEMIPPVPEEVTVTIPAYFCNPVLKVEPMVHPVRHPDDHLIFYLIQPVTPYARPLLTTDQVGNHNLMVNSNSFYPGYLGVPTMKVYVPPPLDFAIDHFKTWTTEIEGVGPYFVSLLDQFQSQPIQVILDRIDHFSNSVDKNHLAQECLVVNGDFENGTLTGWTVTSSSGFGTWVINDGTFDPISPDGPLPPCSGAYSALTDMGGPGIYTLYQDVTIPAAASAMLQWTDMIRNHHGSFSDPDQEFRVEIRNLSDVVLSTVFSTNPGDSAFQPCTSRSADISAFTGQTVRLAFVEEDQLFYQNVHLDDVSVDCSANYYPRLDPNAHLIWYPIEVPQPQRMVKVYNQFHPLGVNLKVQDAKYVLFPAEKSGGGSPNPDYNGDNYLCYEVIDPVPVDQPVLLLDQFDEVLGLPENVMVTVPKYFCNPVQKVDPVTHPDDHLIFYEIFPPTGYNGPVLAVDQFGPHNLFVWDSVYLGVPTEKVYFAIDHFKTWTTDIQLEGPYSVNLLDQFRSQPIQVSLDRIDHFSNSVDKTHDGNYFPRLDPNAHLIWYPIDVPQPQREITAHNQFYPLGANLEVKDAKYVLVPAEKDGGGAPDPDYNGDLYLCYDIIDPTPVDQPVTLLDQFDEDLGGFPENVMVTIPKYFCNPVQKVDPVTHPDDHLIFYEIFPPTGYNGPVLAVDQFGPHNLFVWDSVYLGVPTKKVYVQQPAVCGNGFVEGSEQCDPPDDAACPGFCQPNCTCPANDIVWDPATNPGPWPNNNPEAATRALRFRVTGPVGTKLDAIKITMVDLQHPNPRNFPTYPPPNYTSFDTRMNGICSGGQYNGHHCDTNADCTGTTIGTCSPLAACTAVGETNPPTADGIGGCARWVGRPGTFYESQGPPLTGPYRASRLQCTPFYWDWKSEPGGLVTVVGAEVVPSSEYTVQAFASSCMGGETTCTNVSPAVTMYTRRFGDVDANYNPPSPTNQPDAIDVAQVVNKFKGLAGSSDHYRAQVQPNLPELNASINALDIVSVVDAVKSFAYSFSGPCACPSTQPCGLPCAGCPGMCVRTCVGGDNAGQPCININHCPGGTCAAAGTCRDRCGRCN